MCIYMFFSTQGCTRREEQSLEDKQKAPLSAELQTLNIPKKRIKNAYRICNK